VKHRGAVQGIGSGACSGGSGRTNGVGEALGLLGAGCWGILELWRMVAGM